MSQCHNCNRKVRRVISFKEKQYCLRCRTGITLKKIRKRALTKKQAQSNIGLLIVLVGVTIGIYLIANHTVIRGIATMWGALFIALIPHYIGKIDGEWLFAKTKHTNNRIVQLDEQVRTVIADLYTEYSDHFKKMNCMLHINIRETSPIIKMKHGKWLRNYRSFVQILITNNGELIEYDEGHLVLLVDLVQTHILSVWINKFSEVRSELQQDLDLTYDYISDLFDCGELT